MCKVTNERAFFDDEAKKQEDLDYINTDGLYKINEEEEESDEDTNQIDPD